MSVCLGQVVALNYATTQLKATHALVSLASHLLQTIEHAVVGGIRASCRNVDNTFLMHTNLKIDLFILHSIM